MGKEAKHIGDSLFAGDVSPASLQRPITRPVLAWLGPTLASLSSDKTAKAHFSLPLLNAPISSRCICHQCIISHYLSVSDVSCPRGSDVSHHQCWGWCHTDSQLASARPQLSLASLASPASAWPLLTSSHLSSPQQPLMSSSGPPWHYHLHWETTNNHYRENIHWRLVSFRKVHWKLIKINSRR